MPALYHSLGDFSIPPPLALGSWLLALGYWSVAHLPWSVAHLPWSVAHLPWFAVHVCICIELILFALSHTSQPQMSSFDFGMFLRPKCRYHRLPFPLGALLVQFGTCRSCVYMEATTQLTLTGYWSGWPTVTHKHHTSAVTLRRPRFGGANRLGQLISGGTCVRSWYVRAIVVRACDRGTCVRSW
jgi:hypothetical protein